MPKSSAQSTNNQDKNSNSTHEKNLRNKAIKIQGKEYVLVADRVVAFNQMYPEGYISTDLLSPPEADMVVIKATVTPDVEKPERKFTGYSQAKWGAGLVNRTSALENAETSAVGRALAMMGIGVVDTMASADEINKAHAQESPHEMEQKECPIHHEPMKTAWSERHQRFFHYHKVDGKNCFGK